MISALLLNSRSTSPMSLLRLPPETLMHIFSNVGSSYFRFDVSRLAICKQWNTFACIACFQDFHVTQKTLRSLLSSLYVESGLALIRDNVEILELYLEGFEDWDSIAASRGNASTWAGSHGYAAREAWTAELNDHLLSLANNVKQARKLRILHIEATSEIDPLLLLRRRNYLSIHTIRAFLSTTNLRSLKLDLCGTHLFLPQGQEEEDTEEFHICTTIATLLTTLKTLRLRMRKICADVLKSQGHIVTNLRLNEVLVNLSLANESPLITSAIHATCCDSSAGGFRQLKADLEEQAQVLVTQLAAPKMVRILTHVPPTVEMRAFDVLGGRNVKLGDGAAWDDDGEVIEEEPLSEEESEISDLSSSDNDDL